MKKIKIPKTNKEFSWCSVDDVIDLELFIYRKQSSDSKTIGEFYIGKEQFAYSIESVVRGNINGKPINEKGITALPLGTYEVILKRNGIRKKELPLIIGIFGFQDTWIVDGAERESHEIGIKYKQTDGAERDLIKRLKKIEGKITLTIK